MAAQVFLFTPVSADAAFLPRLEAALHAADVAAMLVRRGTRLDPDYEQFARIAIAAGQQHGAAVLVEGEPDLVERLGADGLHVTSLNGLKPALTALKPAHIVGMGATATRHDAMIAGERGVDYVMFGSPDEELTDEDRERASWWAETFEVPAVLCDPAAEVASVDALNCEFVGLSTSIWQAPEGAPARLAALGQRLRAA